MRNLYYFILAIIAFLTFLVHLKKLNEKKAFYIIAFILIFMSAFRNCGITSGDEYNYRLGTLNYVGKSFEIKELLAAEGGNYFIHWITANVFKTTQPYIAVTAIIANVLILSSVKKYSDNILFSLFLYVASTSYTTSMNISRQYIAIGIIFFAYRFILEEKFVKYALMVVLAYWFHNSALIMLPMYFILRQKELSKWSILWFGIALVMMINFETIAGVLIKGTTYEHYTSSIGEDNGMNPIRTLKDVVVCLPIILLRKNINKNKEKPSFLYNAVLISIMISVASMAFKYAYRFNEYFSIGILVLLPSMIKSLEYRFRSIAAIGIAVMFIVFGYLNITNATQYHNIVFENNLPYGTTYGAKYIK